jgi:hypothetical protein
MGEDIRAGFKVSSFKVSRLRIDASSVVKRQEKVHENLET